MTDIFTNHFCKGRSYFIDPEKILLMQTTEITFETDGGVQLTGLLTLPVVPSCLIIFSHGSGSSRFSTRNQHVAEILNRHNMATLLTDLLTEEEDKVYANRFNIDLLTQRLKAVTANAKQLAIFQNRPIGYFGASTGAASALMAAAGMPDVVKAVVSRGGRPDLAEKALPDVKAPTLLIVGSRDIDVFGLNQQAYEHLITEKELILVEGASHLFEEPGKLDEVAGHAAAWFKRHLITGQPGSKC
jgi:putative phosphoribosyl transferase